MTLRKLFLVLISFMTLMVPVAFAVQMTNYTYDTNGNMVSDGEFYYIYNTANQMIEVRRDSAEGSIVEQYFYDHSGNRVKKVEVGSEGNKTTYYVSGLFEFTNHTDGTTLNTSYFYANGERIARKEANGSNSEVYYYHSDHLHSTSVVTRKGRLMADTILTDHSWQNVSLNESLVRPVVIAKVMTENDADNSVERLDNVSSNGFQVKVEETDGGAHASETIGYIALEEGTITDGGAEIGEAGTIDAGPIWTRVTFPEKFDVVPVVVASAMTTNDQEQGAVRIRNIDITGFDVRFEEYPSEDGKHKLEKIGWVALKLGTWTLDGKTLVASTVSATDSYNSVSLEGFSTTPVILTQIQSYNETDRGSHTRLNNTGSTGFDVKIGEESDTSHTYETVGYIAIEPIVLRFGAAKVDETKYYPYGVTQEGGNEKYLYTGKELDRGTGLYYYEARYYNPKTGRFVQPDTLIPNAYNPQSLNRYSYVLNNPMRYTDPSGHAIFTITAATVATLAIKLIVFHVATTVFAFTLAKNYKTITNPVAPCEDKEKAKINSGLTVLTYGAGFGIPGVEAQIAYSVGTQTTSQSTTDFIYDELTESGKGSCSIKQPATSTQKISTPDVIPRVYSATPYTPYEDPGSYQEMAYGGSYPIVQVQKTVSYSNYIDRGSWQEMGYDSDSTSPSVTSTGGGGGGGGSTGSSGRSVSYSSGSYTVSSGGYSYSVYND